MRFEKTIHWAEGLFLEPQHMQRSQYLMLQQSWQNLSLSMPFAYGLIDLDIDEEALTAQRVVINKLSAVMPDGTYISMPGNCHIEPLQLSFTESDQVALTQGIIIYLSLPCISFTDRNLGLKKQQGRFSLVEDKMLDENTGDNEVSLITREYNVQLVSKEKSTTSYCVLPICRVRYNPNLTNSAQLQLDKTFVPPFLVMSDSCPTLYWANELLFMLKNYRLNLEGEFESDGFDSKLVTGSDILRLNQLSALNSFIERANNLLQPGRCTSFAFYLELCDLLGRLSVLNPLVNVRTPEYQHDNSYPMFQELSVRIRSLLNKNYTSDEFGLLEFNYNNQGILSLSNLEDSLFNSSQYFLAISFDGELKDHIQDIELGDNFRLLDPESFKDRIRGIKLTHLRYPPHFLPSLNHTLWFKLMIEDSIRVWNYIHEDRAMVIDFAPSIFKNLKVRLYFKKNNESGS